MSYDVILCHVMSSFCYTCTYMYIGRAPKTIKLFINQTYTLDFDSAESNTPVQTLKLVTFIFEIVCDLNFKFSLTEEDISDDKTLQLMYLKFQNVQQLTVCNYDKNILFLYIILLLIFHRYLSSTTKEIKTQQWLITWDCLVVY